MSRVLFPAPFLPMSPIIRPCSRVRDTLSRVKRGNKRAFEQDSSYPLLCSLEVVDDEGNLERKADMFTKRTITSLNPGGRSSHGTVFVQRWTN